MYYRQRGCLRSIDYCVELDTCQNSRELGRNPARRGAGGAQRRVHAREGSLLQVASTIWRTPHLPPHLHPHYTLPHKPRCATRFRVQGDLSSLSLEAARTRHERIRSSRLGRNQP
eukprot:7344928-Prymnesium_polylepis.2